jgi:hypothetical protein
MYNPSLSPLRRLGEGETKLNEGCVELRKNNLFFRSLLTFVKLRKQKWMFLACICQREGCRGGGCTAWFLAGLMCLPWRGTCTPGCHCQPLLLEGLWWLSVGDFFRSSCSYGS